MIVIADDDMAICSALKLLLKRAGYNVVAVTDPAEAVAIVRADPVDLVIADMNFGSSVTGNDGIELLRRIKILAPDLPVILMTAWATIPLAVKGMQYGAADFVTKPWNNRALIDTIEAALSLRGRGLSEASGTLDRCGIVGRSSALMGVLEMVRRVAPTEASVLITGENGTGKEMIAKAIHVNSRRSGHPMTVVNLGAIVPTLFESELFGHAKGAFTSAVSARAGLIEEAQDSTLFLDEIGDLSLTSQVKLLRVLQERVYQRVGENKMRTADFRLVSATNRDLREAIASGQFREDLFYRINLITLHLPPLRERRDDIAPLAEHFARTFSPGSEITPEALQLLERLPYPGNVRELRNTIERALIVSGHKRLEPTDFDFASLVAPEPAAAEGGTLDQAERRAIVAALSAHDGNLSAAAASLGISRQALYRRLEKYSLR